MSNIGTNTTDGRNYRVENILSESYNDTVKAIKTTTLATASYTTYESGTVPPGAEANGYDVKITGGKFATTSTAYRTIIKNDDAVLDITIFLNVDNTNPITIKSASELDLTGYAVTNIFIDTPAAYASTVEITLFG